MDLGPGINSPQLEDPVCGTQHGKINFRFAYFVKKHKYAITSYHRIQVTWQRAKGQLKNQSHRQDSNLRPPHHRLDVLPIDHELLELTGALHLSIISCICTSYYPRARAGRISKIVQYERLPSKAMILPVMNAILAIA